MNAVEVSFPVHNLQNVFNIRKNIMNESALSGGGG